MTLRYWRSEHPATASNFIPQEIGLTHPAGAEAELGHSLQNPDTETKWEVESSKHQDSLGATL